MTSFRRALAASLCLFVAFGALASHALTQDLIRSYGRGLAHWMDVRESCGEGARFAGSWSVVQRAVDAYRARSRTLRGYSSAAYTGLTQGFVDRGNRAADQLPSGSRNSITLTIGVQRALSDLRQMRTELNSLIAAGPEARVNPYRITLGAVQEALRLAQAANRVISCRRAEDEVQYIVANTVAAPSPGEPAELPNTLGSHPLVVRGSNCDSLQDVAANLSGILQDSNAAILHDRTHFERAVAAQMVVEYVRRHGGRQGRLDARKDARLRAMTNALVQRYVAREESSGPRPASVTPAATP